jgi:hypothetical protein
MQAQDVEFKHPTSYMWSGGVQREIPFGFIVDVTYVGRRGLYLPRERNINQLRPGTVAANPGVNIAALRPYKGYGGIRMTEIGVLHPGGDRVFAVEPNHAVSVIAAGAALGRPNGIIPDPRGKGLVVVSFDPFHSLAYTLMPGDPRGTLTPIGQGKGKFDGVEPLADGRLLVSAWNDSSIHVLGGGRDERIIRGLWQPADIGGGEGQAPVEAIRKLIALLLDESALSASQINALQAERMETLDTSEAIASGNDAGNPGHLGPVTRYVFAPLYRASALSALESQTAVARVAHETKDWPTALARMEGIKPVGILVPIGLTCNSSPNYNLRGHFEALTERRLAVTALAIRLYQHDHNGARPQRLEELVPTYLPAVPRDAMAAAYTRGMEWLSEDGALPRAGK